jgi:hypothetical protein
MSIRRDQENESSINQREEINNLIGELQELRIDFEERSEALSLRLQRLQLTREVPLPRPTRGNPYLLRDIVRITNNYQGRRGTQGIVIHVTHRRVTLRTQEDLEFTRSYRNVELVVEQEEITQDDTRTQHERPQ